jgi:hypothetical protein
VVELNGKTAFLCCLIMLVLVVPEVEAKPFQSPDSPEPSQEAGWFLTTDRPWYNVGDLVTFLITKPQTHGAAICVLQVSYYITVTLPDGRQSSFNIGGLPDAPGTYPETAGQAGAPPGPRFGQLWGQGEQCVNPQPPPTVYASTNYMVQESGSCQYGGTYPNCNPAPSCQYGGDYPNCNAPPSCQYGGTYPNCYAPPLCQNGGTYPNCNPSTTTVTQQQPPLVISQPAQAEGPNYGLAVVLLAIFVLVGLLFMARNNQPTQPEPYPTGAAQRATCDWCHTPLRVGSFFCPRCGRRI